MAINVFPSSAAAVDNGSSSAKVSAYAPATTVIIAIAG